MPVPEKPVLEGLEDAFAARWERPTKASFKTSGVHPGRLAQGPDEKQGFLGLAVGLLMAAILSCMKMMAKR